MATFPRFFLWDFGRFCTNFPGNSMKLFAQCSGLLKITLHSAAAEEIIKNHIAFLGPGGINYVVIVGPTVQR